MLRPFGVRQPGAAFSFVAATLRRHLLALTGSPRTDGTLSDVCLTRLVWLITIGGFRSRGNFPPVPRFLRGYERAKRRMAHPFKKQTRKGGAPSVVKLRVLHPPAYFFPDVSLLLKANNESAKSFILSMNGRDAKPANRASAIYGARAKSAMLRKV